MTADRVGTDGGPRLLVAEMFGPTVQGEGPSTGRPAVFVRLSRCNLTCPPCDTPYTWDRGRYDLRAESTRLSGDEVVAWVLARPARLVVVTGGEPLLQQRALVPVAAALAAAGRRVEVETNGTVVPARGLVEVVDGFNVSPKLARFAGDPPAGVRPVNPAALAAFVASGKAVFKFVVAGTADLIEVEELRAAHGLNPVWVMPEGTTPERVTAVAREIADEVIVRGWHLSTRLHVLLWGDTRGR